jgi:hypothetical protein
MWKDIINWLEDNGLALLATVASAIIMYSILFYYA